MKPLRALILMPLDKAHGQVRDIVASTLKEQSVEVVSVDQVISPGALWANAITEAIQTADVIVADVSSGSPHVLYELGFSHALRKPTLLLLSTHSVGVMPPELSGYQILTYDPANLSPLRQQIIRFLDYQQSRLGVIP
ncbi:MAG: nucleoside 2-deoxyribosyltransferase [Pseudomonadota bacterium]|nr:nucleoside 2-deoxyribosyltransferase [Pseudomonadota bacterium]